MGCPTKVPAFYIPHTKGSHRWVVPHRKFPWWFVPQSSHMVYAPHKRCPHGICPTYEKFPHMVCPTKVPTFYIPHKIKIGKRNGRAPKKRTKIKCPFFKSGNFSLQKNRVFSVLTQMQQIPKKSCKSWLHKFLGDPGPQQFRRGRRSPP